MKIIVSATFVGDSLVRFSAFRLVHAVFLAEIKLVISRRFFQSSIAYPILVSNYPAVKNVIYKRVITLRNRRLGRGKRLPGTPRFNQLI